MGLSRNNRYERSCEFDLLVSSTVSYRAISFRRIRSLFADEWRTMFIRGHDRREEPPTPVKISTLIDSSLDCSSFSHQAKPFSSIPCSARRRLSQITTPPDQLRTHRSSALLVQAFAPQFQSLFSDSDPHSATLQTPCRQNNRERRAANSYNLAPTRERVQAGSGQREGYRE